MPEQPEEFPCRTYFADPSALFSPKKAEEPFLRRFLEKKRMRESAVEEKKHIAPRCDLRNKKDDSVNSHEHNLRSKEGRIERQSEAKTLYANGYTVREIAKRLRVQPVTVYKYLNPNCDKE